MNKWANDPIHTYIVIVGVAHLETTVPLIRGARSSCVVAENVAKRMASSPLATATPDVSLHGVRLGEIVPRPNKQHGLDRRVCLTGVACQRSVHDKVGQRHGEWDEKEIG